MLNRINFYFLIGIISFSTLLMACGDDDENPGNSSIIGTWNYSSYNYDATINDQTIVAFLMSTTGLTQAEAQLAEAYLIASYFSDEDLENSSLEFNADGTFVVKENGSQVDSGTYLLQNNNTKLIITSEDGVEEFDVKELSKLKLVLSSTGEEQMELTGDGELETIAYTLDLTFIK